ncbi:MAG: alanine--tRNA ligase [Candidatus Dormibacteria bacterium]
MLSDQIRAHFLDYFQQHGHLLVPSAPLVPRDDPSLLLVSAGMVPFKPYFLGWRQPPRDRLTSCQKSFRMVDIDEVGSSPRHDTFFEMLGNFSFGAYFKAEAIGYAFELLTRDFGLDPERLHPSVHPADLESASLWERVAGIPQSRIARLEDNVWQAGPTGPFGVDSEIYYDLGPVFGNGPEERPGTGSRYLEIWNLVFMDSERFDDGSSAPLEHPGVDTGMGLERIAMVLQEVDSIFATDLFAPIITDFVERSRPAESISGAQRLRHLRILADHTRGACSLLADGVLPSNEGRGYVLRRIVRRALVSALSLGVSGGLAPAAEVVVRILGGQYPEIETSSLSIRSALEQESIRFQETVERGAGQFEAIAGRARAGRISGDDAFRLHDTFGFPYELTQDLAAARGLGVDRERFLELLGEQRERARASRAGVGAGVARVTLPESRFVGYDDLEVITSVAAVLQGGAIVPRAGAGETAEVVLAENPFYVEGGGQVGDRGLLTWDGGRAEVLDSRPSNSGSSVQVCRVEAGELVSGQTVTARVDPGHRSGCAAHHSATHLLNRTLRLVLGAGVVQRGSLVAPDHATFDFSWSVPLTDGQLAEVEHLVNQQLRRDLPRRVELLPIAEARRSGAVELPDETYGDLVRVVGFGDFSRELCGGTHVARSGEVGAVVLTGSRSVGQGLRRIELVAGAAAEAWWVVQRHQLSELSAAVRSPAAEVVVRVRHLQERVRGLERELRRSRELGAAKDVIGVETVAGITLVVEDLPAAMERRELRRHADRLLEQAPEGCAVVLSGDQILIRVSERLVVRGLSAGTMAQAVCQELGGRGGGNQQLGQGVIPEEAHRAALATVRTILGTALEEG